MKKEQKTVLVQNVYQIRVGTPSAGTSIEYYLKWRAFIDYINTVGDADPSRLGSTYSAIYGVVNGIGTSFRRDEFDQDETFHTLDAAIDELGITINFDVSDYVQLYDNSVVLFDPNEHIEITSDDSRYQGMYAHREDVVTLSYGCGTAVYDECSSLYDDGCDYFVSEQASDYDIVWSDWHGYYLDSNDDYTHYGVVNSGGRRDWFHDCDYVWCDENATYYRNSSIAEDNGVYYSESRGEYIVGCDDENNIQDNNASYHSGLDRRIIDEDASWKIGFEIEKEDLDAGAIHYRQLYDRTYWCKEADSSLDSDSGYELISPVYDLYGKSLDLALKDKEIECLINASQSSNCGGHIHVSCKEFNTDQLFEGFSGFYPLLYALYEFRVDRTYCQAKKKHEYYRRDKYSAVFIRDYTVEFRIFSAVKNVSNLLWRRDLIRIMADNFNKSELDVLKMMVNPNSKLYKHLRKVFPQDKMMDKVRLFVKYADLYGNKKLPMPKQTPKDNLPNTDELGA